MNEALMRTSIVQVLENHRIPHSVIVALDIVQAVQAIQAIDAVIDAKEIQAQGDPRDDDENPF